MNNKDDRDIFGAVRMGYVVVGSRKLEEWRRFATEAIGLHLAHDSPALLAFRMDEYARRLIVKNDDAEDVIAIGWQLDDESVLQVVLDRLARKGVTAQKLDDANAAARGVCELYRFKGPKGLHIELFTRPLMQEASLSMLVSGFKLGNAGLGHISLMSLEPKRSIAFWKELLDARLSDRIELSNGGKQVMEVSFLRVNERHHSIAIAATTGRAIDMFRTRIQHMNIEAATLDDLTGAFQRCRDMGYKLARNVGQHPNDKELSFYVTTPSGFELEIGWDALTVNEECWQAGKTYFQMSTWGHDIPGRFSTELGFSHVINGIRSLWRSEYYPW